MAYKKEADGNILKKGRTNVKIEPDSGPDIIDKGPKKSSSSLNSKMKTMGRNLAKCANQKGSK